MVLGFLKRNFSIERINYWGMIDFVGDKVVLDLI